MKKKLITESEIRQITERVSEEWMAQHGNAEAIRMKVTKHLEKHLMDSMARTLGFEKDSWSGGWRIDHCNGRMSYLTKIVEECVTEEFKDQLKGIIKEGFTLGREEVSALRKEYKRVLGDQIGTQIRKMAVQKAEEEAERILQDYTPFEESPTT